MSFELYRRITKKLNKHFKHLDQSNEATRYHFIPLITLEFVKSLKTDIIYANYYNVNNARLCTISIIKKDYKYALSVENNKFYKHYQQHDIMRDVTYRILKAQSVDVKLFVTRLDYVYSVLNKQIVRELRKSALSNLANQEEKFNLRHTNIPVNNIVTTTSAYNKDNQQNPPNPQQTTDLQIDKYMRSDKITSGQNRELIFTQNTNKRSKSPIRIDNTKEPQHIRTRSPKRDVFDSIDVLKG